MHRLFLMICPSYEKLVKWLKNLLLISESDDIIIRWGLKYITKDDVVTKWPCVGGIVPRDLKLFKEWKFLQIIRVLCCERHTGDYPY